MRLQCVKLPHKRTNCLVITLGAGKAVKFAVGEIVDLADPKYGFADPEVIGHQMLGKHPGLLKLLPETQAAPRSPSPKTKAVHQAPMNK